MRFLFSRTTRRARVCVSGYRRIVPSGEMVRANTRNTRRGTRATIYRPGRFLRPNRVEVLDNNIAV